MSDDLALLRHYAIEHREDAFAELVRRHLDAVYSAALRRLGGDAHLAEDVAQQVFVALARKAAVVSRHSVVSAWLYVATRNEAANVVRRERRRKQREQEAYAMETVALNPPDQVPWHRVAPILDGMIDQLSERDRTAVLLRYFERRSFAEVAAVLHVSEDAARMRVDRALERLRIRLARRGIVSTSVAVAAALAGNLVSAAPPALATTVTAAALTAPPVAAISLVSALELMSTTKALSATVALLVLVAVGTATWQWQVARSATDAVRAATRENEQLTHELVAFTERVANSGSVPTTLQSRSDAPRTSTETSKTSERAVSSGGRSMQEPITAGRDFLERHPELRQAVTEYARAQMAALWRGYYRAHHLSAEQIDVLERAMTLDSGVLRRINGPDGAPLTLTAPGFGDQAQRADAQRAVVAALGSDAIPELRDYIRQIPARRLATQLAGALYCTPAPLAPEQIDPFIQIVLDTGAVAPGWRGRYDWSAIHKNASAVLSAPQLAVLSGFEAQNSYEQALAAAMRSQAGIR